MTERLLNFGDRPLGTVFLLLPGHQPRDLGPAVGAVMVPEAQPVGLRLDVRGADELRVLASLPHDALQYIDLAGLPLGG